MKRRNEFDVYAVSSGTVLHVLEEVRESDGYFSSYGLRVLILHPDGTVGWYCHLDKTHLSRGMKVKAGSIIGRMGNTGMNKQQVIYRSELDTISKLDPDLYTWLNLFVKNKSGDLSINKKMRTNLVYWKKLEVYLHKHLHLMLTPSNQLAGKYALNPIEWLEGGTPPVNTKQSIGGGWQATYKNSNGNEYNHEGVDFSGNILNIICGWESVSNSFKCEFYDSIDKVV